MAVVRPTPKPHTSKYTYFPRARSISALSLFWSFQTEKIVGEKTVDYSIRHTKKSLAARVKKGCVRGPYFVRTCAALGEHGDTRTASCSSWALGNDEIVAFLVETHGSHEGCAHLSRTTTNCTACFLRSTTLDVNVRIVLAVLVYSPTVLIFTSDVVRCAARLFGTQHYHQAVSLLGNGLGII